MSKKLKFLFAALAIIIVSAGATWYQLTKPVPLNSKDYVQTTTPTLFFHGFGSSSNAEKHMANAAKERGVTNTIIEANVEKGGKVTLKGNIPSGAVNPIVLINYEDNQNNDPKTIAGYAYNVVKSLQDKYSIKTMNMVGHSMGNMSIMYYMIEHGADTSLPQLQKQVDIAGHFNGIIGMNEPEKVTLDADGKPSSMTDWYKNLMKIRETYPKNQVDVLNIYGDTGDQSDESVTNVSSQSLKYLVASSAKSYREEKISGPDGQHSQLHETSKVDDILIPFLWGK